MLSSMCHATVQCCRHAADPLPPSFIMSFLMIVLFEIFPENMMVCDLCLEQWA